MTSHRQEPRAVLWVSKIFEIVSVAILLTLTALVIAGVLFRYLGSALIWYDEIAIVLLAWLTFSGSALAALRRAHLGFSGLLLAMPLKVRYLMFFVAEGIVYAFLLTMIYAGWHVLEIFGDEALVALPIPLSVTQSILPIGFAAYTIAQLISMPRELERIRSNTDSETEEIMEELERNRHLEGSLK
jgi:TRAP-type C4-dicarboxylate transport system permease small subunit